MTKSQKIWLAIGTGLAALIIIALWRAGVACSTPRIRSALKIGDAAGCYEFWFNRYQSALGGFLAVVGAFIAGRYAVHAARLAAEPVKMQLRVSERQTALLALPLLREMIAAEVEEETRRKQIEKNLIATRDFSKIVAEGDRDWSKDSRFRFKWTIPLSESAGAYLGHVQSHPRGSSADINRFALAHLARATGSVFDDLGTSVEKRRTLAITEAEFNSAIADFLIRLRSHDQILMQSLTAVHDACENRREKAANQIAAATQLTLS